MEVPLATAVNFLPSALAVDKFPLDLKLSQVLPAQVLATSVDGTQIGLSAEGYTLQLQTPQSLSLQPGQVVQLQVAKLVPITEFFLSTSPVLATSSGTAPGGGDALLTLIRVSTYQSSDYPGGLPMEINSSVTSYPALTNSVSTVAGLDLKVNQIIDAKVIETQVALNTFSLSVAGKTIQVQAQALINLQPGQSVQIQVLSLVPVPEFKLISSAVPTGNLSANQAAIAKADTRVSNLNQLNSTQEATGVLLKLIATSPDSVTSPQKSLNSAGLSPQSLVNSSVSTLASGQKITAFVVSIADHKVSVQLPLALPSAAETQAKPLNPGGQLLTLDARQLLYVGSDGNGKRSAEIPASVLIPGTQINLQLLKSGAQPVYALSFPPPPPLITEQKINDILKQLLPIQSSPANLLNHLTQMLPVLENHQGVAETLKQLARQILAAIPAQANLQDAGQVQHSIAQSGIFLEAKLAEMLAGHSDQNLSEDLKFKLLKLVESLNTEVRKQGVENTETERNTQDLRAILEKTQGALAKISLDQFHSVPNDLAAKQVWVLELPFFHQQQAETVRVEIEHDKSHKPQPEDRHWAVSITITPPDLATIYCNISCFDGAINTRFWSDSTATVEKINVHLEHLKKQFESKGLKAGFMEAHQGKPSSTQNQNKPVSNLLNEKV